MTLVTGLPFVIYKVTAKLVNEIQWYSLSQNVEVLEPCENSIVSQAPATLFCNKTWRLITCYQNSDAIVYVYVAYDRWLGSPKTKKNRRCCRRLGFGGREVISFYFFLVPQVWDFIGFSASFRLASVRSQYLLAALSVFGDFYRFFRTLMDLWRICYTSRYYWSY